MYLILFISILLSLFRELKLKRRNIFVFHLTYIAMTAMVVFRYGQGTDYFGYMYLYNNVDLESAEYQKDIGYYWLCSISKENGVQYTTFSAIFGLLTMLLAYPFFSKICKKSMFSLFIFYAYVFLIYPMSGIRQGFTIALLLGLLYPLYEKRNFLFYYLVIIVGSLIHGSLIICSILPYLAKIKINRNWEILLFILATVINLLNVNLYTYLPTDFGLERGVDLASAEDSVNYLGKFFRVAIIGVYLIIPRGRFSEESFRVRSLVFFGYLIYSLLCFVGTVAGRVEIYFRVFEMLLLVLLFYDNIHLKNLRVNYILIVLYTVLFVKNIDSQISQGDYLETNIFTYPYVHIFNPDEIKEVRKDEALLLRE